MKSIAMLSQKGGSGKTTIAVHLATQAVMDKKKVLIIDTDPQKSAETWYSCRDQKDPALATIAASDLKELLAIAKNEGIDLVVIDTMPHTSAASSIAALHADFLLIPCQPTPFDIAAVGSSIEIAMARGKKAGLIINRAPLRAPEIMDTRKALEAYGVTIYPHEITDRRTYFRAITQGLSVTEYDPNSAAAQEISKLWFWVKEQIK